MLSNKEIRTVLNRCEVRLPNGSVEAQLIFALILTLRYQFTVFLKYRSRQKIANNNRPDNHGGSDWSEI